MKLEGKRFGRAEGKRDILGELVLKGLKEAWKESYWGAYQRGEI